MRVRRGRGVAAAARRVSVCARGVRRCGVQPSGARWDGAQAGVTLRRPRAGENSAVKRKDITTGHRGTPQMARGLLPHLPGLAPALGWRQARPESWRHSSELCVCTAGVRSVSRGAADAWALPSDSCPSDPLARRCHQEGLGSAPGLPSPSAVCPPRGLPGVVPG